jgi:DNA-binding NtrC family response regulator
MYQPQIQHIDEEIYFVAASPAARRLRTQAELVSQADVPVLITGEPGSGKTTTARLIHSLSIRSSFPFMQVNCAALTADLLESELFGYEHLNGAGRLESKSGRLEQCARGTLLLQDFEAMPLSVQMRLLQALQTREFVRFGGQTPLRTEVRVMAATCGDLQQAVAGKNILEELYYHVNVFELKVPPIRERREEIPLLLGHFMNRLTRRYSVPPRHFSPALLQACQRCDWSGNLAQLEIFVKRFLVSGDENAALEELNAHSHYEAENGQGDGFAQEEFSATEERSSLKSLVRHAKGEAERSAIAQALEETEWNRKAAARLLRISYRALLYKIQQYELAPPAVSRSLTVAPLAEKRATAGTKRFDEWHLL